MIKTNLIVFGMALWMGNAIASDPVGIYGTIDKVVYDKNEDPTTAQIWGTFRLAQGKQGTGSTYTPATYGYLYFGLVDGKEKEVRMEWKDLEKEAGKGRCLAFGGRHQKKVTLRLGNWEKRGQDEHPLNFGVQVVEKEICKTLVLK